MIIYLCTLITHIENMDLDLAILAHIDVEISWNKCSQYAVWSDLKREYMSVELSSHWSLGSERVQLPIDINMFSDTT